MKKLTILLLIAIALVGCGRESERIDTEATQAKDDVQTLTIAWHKVSEADGSICDLSIATQQTVDEAAGKLSQALATDGVDIVVKTLTPEKVEGGDCLCNRVLIQGRFVDEWLGAEMVKTACSGCPNQAGCPKSAGSGGACGGQYAMIHQDKTYSIVPANLIVMAGLIAAADLTGEQITYGGCPGAGACKGECICANCGVSCTYGKCESDCVCENCGVSCRYQATGAECNPDCPGMATGCTAACKGGQAVAEKTVAADTNKGGCPRAGQCKGNACPASGQ